MIQSERLLQKKKKKKLNFQGFLELDLWIILFKRFLRVGVRRALTYGAGPGGCWCFRSRTDREIERPPRCASGCLWFNLTGGARRAGIPSDTQTHSHTPTMTPSPSLLLSLALSHTHYSDEWITSQLHIVLASLSLGLHTQTNTRKTLHNSTTPPPPPPPSALLR